MQRRYLKSRVKLLVTSLQVQYLYFSCIRVCLRCIYSMFEPPLHCELQVGSRAHNLINLTTVTNKGTEQIFILIPI